MKLFATDGTPNGYFGLSAAADGDVVVVCAASDADPSNVDGAAYVFRHDGGAWVLEAKLFADDAVFLTYFGKSVAVEDDLIVVGAYGNTDIGPYGAAYVYRYNGSTWEFEQRLLGSQQTLYHYFGYSVAIDGDRIMVGAAQKENGDPDVSDWAYIYRWDNGSWIEEVALEHENILAYDWFGRSVDIKGNIAVVGCPARTYGPYLGKVFVYVGSGAPYYVWGLWTILTPSDPSEWDYFGEQVKLMDENTIIVQAFGNQQSGYGQSTIYVFRRDGVSWIETGKLVPEDPGDFFGWEAAPTLAVDDGQVLTGAPLEDNQNGVDAGSAFYYDISCAGDLNSDRVVDQSDLGILLASYGIDDGGDVDGDGDTDQADLGALLANYGAICP